MRRRPLTLTAALLLAFSSVPVMNDSAAAGPPDRPPVDAGPVDAGPIDAAPVDPGDPNEVERFVVEFDQEAALEPAARIADRDVRGQYVVDALQQVADDAQAGAIAIVEATPGAQFESYWVTNALVVDGTSALRDQLASLPGVRAVRDESSFELITPVAQSAPEAADLLATTWGVERIGAPAAWSQGIFGGGVVVGSLDSGVQYDHPAIVNQYRGNLGGGTFDHNYNWFDASGDCPGTEPCDLFGHGTHTMGTMVGGDGPGPFEPDIGVAPGARWMSVSCGPFFCTDSQLMAAAEWFIAPTDLNGENPDPSKRPDVINNSWGGGPGDPFFSDYVTAWRAAGIVPVFASGNSGPGCGTGGSPGDFVDSYSVGATDINDQIAAFSSRGPSVFGKNNPQVSAPGVDVLSSVPGDGYELNSGTSMATPHVVGAMALMMSADPSLRGKVDTVSNLTSITATDIIDRTCGGDADGDPNNVYGDGRIDAGAAARVVATGGIVAGFITQAASGAIVAGARVTVVGEDWESSAFSDERGVYWMLAPEGTYTVLATAFGFRTALEPAVDVVNDQFSYQSLALDALPTATLRGQTRSAESGAPLPGVTVQAVGTPTLPVVSDADGFYALTLPVGTYDIRGSRGGCLTTDTVTVELANNQRQNLRLAKKIDNAGHGCGPIDFDWVEAENQSGTYGDDLLGRLVLPFDFPFYDESYDRVFVSTNGYLTFIADFAGFSPPNNVPIPDAFPPRAAIYALWQDLIIDDDAFVSYGTIDGELGQAFVIEYDDVAVFGSDNRFDMEIKLWEDGTIDVLYGEGLENVGNGAQATIGLENAAGDDALQYSFNEVSVMSNTAVRYETVDTAVVRGVTRNANDGLPISEITVTAQPGGRSAVSDEDGQYELVLPPGRFTLTATGENYVSTRRSVRLEAGDERTRNIRLAAASVSVTPTALRATVEQGETAERAIIVTNDGSAPLDWELKEQGGPGSFPGAAPALQTSDGEVVYRRPTWERQDVPDELRGQALNAPVYAGTLDTVIVDPIDASGSVEVTSVRAGAEGSETSIAIDFSASTPMNELSGFLYFDTDQNASTGLPAQALNGLPTQDVGMEYFADLFGASFGEVLIVDAQAFNIVAIVPAVIDGQSLRFDIPFDALADPDGTANIAGVLGDFAGPTDWVPDVGFGTIEPFRDVLWLASDPSAGSLAPGASVIVTATLGDPDLRPSAYSGRFVLVSNAPRNDRVEIEVDLDVLAPPLAAVSQDQRE